MLGRLIVIDGIDGCGKGTQIKFLDEEFGSTGEFLFTREPGGTPFAEEIREVILRDRNEKVLIIRDLLLFWASRSDHLENLIIPALESGKIVISDRFDSSSFAFQIRAEEYQELESLFFDLRENILCDIVPTYIFLDLPPKVSLERMKKDIAKKKNHFDLRPIEYHERARKGFLEYFASTSYIVDADRPAEEVYESIRKIVLGWTNL